MLKLGELSESQLQRSLARGLTLKTGPFRFRVQSDAADVAQGLAKVYPDFTLAESETGFRDFHVRIDSVAGPRRWFRPQVNFWSDGASPFKPLGSAQACALMEWGMNWCIATRAHHFLLIHAGVLERNGRCVILPGDPGAGKSTLTAALALSGWRLLSDELTIIDPDDGGIFALARPVGLKNQSIDIIRAFSADAIFGSTAHDTHKGSVALMRPPQASVERVDEKGWPAHIVFPSWRSGAATRLTPRPKADAFMHLAGHAFNYSLLGRQGFDLNAGLIDACDCWDFEYSQLDEALRSFEGLVA